MKVPGERPGRPASSTIIAAVRAQRLIESAHRRRSRRRPAPRPGRRRATRTARAVPTFSGTRRRTPGGLGPAAGTTRTGSARHGRAGGRHLARTPPWPRQTARTAATPSRTAPACVTRLTGGAGEASVDLFGEYSAWPGPTCQRPAASRSYPCSITGSGSSPLRPARLAQPHELEGRDQGFCRCARSGIRVARPADATPSPLARRHPGRTGVAQPLARATARMRGSASSDARGRRTM